jgi:hypothetical protein
MDWDIGFRGLGALMGYALGFGLLAQLFAGKGITHWMWLIASTVFFLSGLLISEAWFGWATEQDLQPNIDGLSRDEALLAIFPGIASVLLTRNLVKRSRDGDQSSIGLSPT